MLHGETFAGYISKGYEINMTDKLTPNTDQPTLFDRAKAVIESIRPAIQSDGGDVELVGITSELIAQIRFHGACVGCPSSSMTLHMGIERNLIEKCPEIKAVEQID